MKGHSPSGWEYKATGVRRGPKYIPNPEEIPDGLCECGCGGETEVATKTVKRNRWFLGYPKPLLPGHFFREHGARHHFWKGGLFEGPGGYWLRYAPTHPNANARGYVMEHRLVVEEMMGRLLEPHETIHHRDGDKANNLIKNLELWKGRHGKGVRAADYHCYGCRCHELPPLP